MMQRSRAVLLAFLSFLLVLASCSPKPVDLVMAYQHTYNSHDLGELLPLFTDDSTFEVEGAFKLKGKDDIRRVAEYDFALHIHMTIDKLVPKGDTVFCELIEMNDWLEATDIEEAYYSAKFVFQKRKIKSLSCQPYPETEKVFKSVFQSLMQWASRERPEQLAQMMKEGKFVYSAENAEKSLALLREWKESTRIEEEM